MKEDKMQIRKVKRKELNGRLNKVAPLVTEFEELSHVTSPIWSRDKMNWGIRLFHEQDLFVRSSRWAHPTSLLYILDLSRVSVCLFFEHLWLL